MQHQSSIFKKWIPKKLIVPLLILALFPHLMLLTIFNMNSTFTASFLDLEVDDLQFMFSMAYALMVCTLLFHVRLFQFFNIRSYLLVMTLLNIVVLFAMSITTNTQLILILRFIQGPLTLLEGCILLPILMSAIKSVNSKIIGYSLLYGYMLTGDKFATSIIKFAIQNYHHNMILYAVIILHLVTLLIYLILFNKNRMFPKKPLYQLNSGGIVMLMIALVSGAYFLIYGKKLYWFESDKIVWSFVFFCLFSAMFIWYQKSSKRTLFHFEIFQSKRVFIGLILFFIFYIIRSGMSNVYQVMTSVWKWHWEYVLQIQYFNVAGSILGVYIAYLLLKRTVNNKTIFAFGFLILAISMFWFRAIFYPDTQLLNIAPPLFLEGLGQGILFTPLVMYMLGSVHPSISGSVSLSGTAIRFWTTTFGFALMQNTMLHLTTKYEALSLGNLTETNPIFQEQWKLLYAKFSKVHTYNDAISLTVTSLKSKVTQHAVLMSNIEIFTVLGIIAITVSTVLFYFYFKDLIIKNTAK